jgi:hypothetical protein
VTADKTTPARSGRPPAYTTARTVGFLGRSIYAMLPAPPFSSKIPDVRKDCIPAIDDFLLSTTQAATQQSQHQIGR